MSYVPTAYECVECHNNFDKSFIVQVKFLMVFGSKIVSVIYDILRGVNAIVWGGVEGAEKVGKIVKTGVSGADVVIGTSHALEDFGCNDTVCGTIDVVGSVSSAVGLVLGNIPATKHLTLITCSVT
eukprot:CAMPEP_0194158578 /NCGR_PEP_ID=MMETSP0152-20130528/76766_1 /TAXON_ID=1049557 /ORGANISM="Thalassiothrix antarctica, Strain L6-D1" /LENGTH=125 /DNA_ID=CAMNT_0038867943 /DNA_START=29 /DNA_END=403 /DNA_ORIENTATION=+